MLEGAGVRPAEAGRLVGARPLAADLPADLAPAATRLLLGTGH